MKKNNIKIAVVIPVKNESEIIELALSKVLCVLESQEYGFKVVCVDDGSEDKTWEIISKIAFSDPRVTAVQLTRNFGHDAALFAGIESVSADAYITMDCDGQHPFDFIPNIIKRWEEGDVDVVNCIKKRRGKESFWYRISVSLFSKFLSFALKQNLSNATEFKLINRRAADFLLDMPDFHIFYRALVPWIGMRQTELKFDVGVEMRKGRNWHLRSLTKFALSGIVMFSDLPILLIFWLGVIALGICVVLFMKLVVSVLMGHVPAGYSTILILLLMNLGFTMVGLGVLGIYVRTALSQAIGRPRALIQRVVECEKFIQIDA